MTAAIRNLQDDLQKRECEISRLQVDLTRLREESREQQATLQDQLRLSAETVASLSAQVRACRIDCPHPWYVVLTTAVSASKG